jgi:hypothetical protein
MMTNEVAATEMRIIIIVWGIYGQMGRVWQADPGYGPFNSVWANPTQSSCLDRSLGL